MKALALTVMLALSFFLAPLAAEAQPPTKVYRPASITTVYQWRELEGVTRSLGMQLHALAVARP